MSVPEACACIWYDVDAERRFLLGYYKRFVTLGAEAVYALEQLSTLTPKAKRQRMARIIGWNADTARRWLKKPRQRTDTAPLERFDMASNPSS